MDATPASPVTPQVPPPITARERVDAIRLARTGGIGPVNFSRFMTQYRSATTALAALPERMRRAGRLDPLQTPSRTEMEDELDRLETLGGRALLRSDTDYPLWLNYLPDAPPLIFVRGDTARLSMRSVGIVGARNASAAGIRMASSLSGELATAGVCVISGLARGIDAAAHENALFPGLTVAAIAGGLDHAYPPEHAKLQAEIAERGCLVTEATLGTIPQARHFPRRNRLIAGMSQGCVVVEAALRSGTLITARLAADYGRALFAVPGSPLDPRSRGGNDLLRHGAILTESARDVLVHLGEELPERNPPPWHEKITKNDGFPGFREPPHPWSGMASPCHEPARDVLEKLYPVLSVTPVTVDEVVRHCQFSVSAVLTALTELELGGHVEFLPGGRVALLPNSEAIQRPEWQ